MLEINQTYILISLGGALISSILYYLYKNQSKTIVKEDKNIKNYLVLSTIICILIFIGLNINKYIESENSILGSNLETKEILYGTPNF
tara:strand:- start:5423 stop:5686 length:264 start_codon:yes stop_codon:yes gene_type:complete